MASVWRGGIRLGLFEAGTSRFSASASGRAPGWMMSLVRRYDLLRRGFSKYCAGVDQLWARERPYDQWLKQARYGGVR